MNKVIFAVTCLSVMFVCSCKKKESTKPVNNTRVGTVYDDSTHVYTVYNYSPTYLISSSFDDSGRYNYSYHYQDGQSITEASANNLFQYSVVYIWNSQSLADSADVLNANGSINTRKKYAYDGSGYLTGVKWYNSNNALILTESYTITGGNVTEHSYNAIDTGNAGLPKGTYTYQYNTSQANTLSNQYFGQAYLGTSSTNTVTSCVYTYGGLTNTTHYSYNYSSTYISSQLVFADSSGVPSTRIDSISYGYYIQ